MLELTARRTALAPATPRKRRGGWMVLDFELHGLLLYRKRNVTLTRLGAEGRGVFLMCEELLEELLDLRHLQVYIQRQPSVDSGG